MEMKFRNSAMGFTKQNTNIRCFFVKFTQKTTIPFTIRTAVTFNNKLIRASKTKVELQDDYRSCGINPIRTQELGVLHSDVSGDSNMYASLLESCAKSKALEEGKQVHAQMIVIEIQQTVFLSSKLVSLYARCGNLRDACLVFDKMHVRNLFSWNAMIAGYARHGLCGSALKLYYQMQRTGVQPDNFTFPRVLKACAGLEGLEQGKKIHYCIITAGFESDVFVGNALIDMYAKCGSIKVARQVFDKMSQRDLVSWNALIAGYSQNGHFDEALKLFRQMNLVGVKPDPVSITTVLPACACLGTLQQGKEFHDHIIKSGFGSNVYVGNSLIDMYFKCGSIEYARHVFDKMPFKDVVTWNAVMAGYGMHGHGETTLGLFYQMQQSGIKPDRITFLALLSACSHGGLVVEGWQYFDSMSQEYCITPKVEHYACMVDLLGRAGLLDEAHDFIKKMPLEPNADVWGALLGACRIHSNMDKRECVVDCLFELEPEDPGYYVLVSNIYADSGRWDCVEKVRARMKDRGLKKRPGCSWIEVNNRIHAFLVGDRSHPQSEKIYTTLENLSEQMKSAGYFPNTNFVLCDV